MGKINRRGFAMQGEFAANRFGQPHSGGVWGGLRGRSRRFRAVCRPDSLDVGLISVDLARSMGNFAHATAWGGG